MTRIAALLAIVTPLLLIEFGIDHPRATKVTSILRSGRRPTSPPMRKPLIDAVRAGDLAEVERLLVEGVDIDATDRSGRTPLMFAALGRSSLELARQLHRDEIVALLEAALDDR